MAWHQYFILALAVPWTDQTLNSDQTQHQTSVQGLYTPLKPLDLPHHTVMSNSYRRLLKESDGNNVNEMDEDEDNDSTPTMPARRLLAAKFSQNEEGNVMPTLTWAKQPIPIKELSGPKDKASEALTHQAFNNVGCAYVGVPCTAMYYPYSTFKSKGENNKYRSYNGYWQGPKETGDLQDVTDYKWNILASFPYIAKSPLFGTYDEQGRLKYNPHGRPFDDASTSPEITSGKVSKVIITGKGRVTSITFEYKGGASVKHGKQGKDSESVSLELADDEHFVKASFSNCKVRSHTRLCGISLSTSKDRTIAHGPPGEMFTRAPKGYVISGFFGRKGNNIDLVGLVAIDFKAMESASKLHAMKRYDGVAWSNTQYPGIARSNIIGGTTGRMFNEAFMMPENILQMRLQSLTLYGRMINERVHMFAFTGMRFGYDNGAAIEIGTAGDARTFIDLGASGRIERISIQLMTVTRGSNDNEYFRVGAATVDYSDEDGNTKSASVGETSGCRRNRIPRNPIQVFEIPKGTELVAAYGTEGKVLDSIGWIVRKSVSPA